MERDDDVESDFDDDFLSDLEVDALSDFDDDVVSDFDDPESFEPESFEEVGSPSDDDFESLSDDDFESPSDLPLDSDDAESLVAEPRLSFLKKPLPLKVTPTGWKTFLTAIFRPVSGCLKEVKVSSVKACWTSIVSPVFTNL